MEEREAAAALLEVSRSEKGGAPHYGPYKVLAALRVLEGGAVGRLRLAQALGLGEASARTLLQRLKEIGLVEIRERGAELSVKGKEVLRSIESAIVIMRASFPFPGWEKSMIVVLKGFAGPRDLVDVYRLRDWIVMEGCNEAVIGNASESGVDFPGLPEEIKSIMIPLIPTSAPGVLLIVPERCEEMVMNASIKMLASRKEVIRNN